MRKLLILSIILALSGFSTIALAVDCEGADWQAIGFQTAIRGDSVRKFETFKRRCGEQLEPSAKSLYSQGYSLGSIEYCTYDNGFALGTDDMQVSDVCPYETRTDFEKGYLAGNQNSKIKAKMMRRHTDEIQKNTFEGRTITAAGQEVITDN